MFAIVDYLEMHGPPWKRFIHSGTKSVKKERLHRFQLLFPLLDNDRLCKTHTFLSSVFFFESCFTFMQISHNDRCLSSARVSPLASRVLDLMIFLIVITDKKRTHFLLLLLSYLIWVTTYLQVKVESK